MSEKRLIDIDPLTGGTQTFEYDDGESRTLVHEVTDVSPIIENNKRLQTDGTGGWNKDHTFRRAASIPLAVVEMWRLQYGIDVFNKDHMPAVMRLLNSSEWAFLRTAQFNL